MFNQLHVAILLPILFALGCDRTRVSYPDGKWEGVIQPITVWSNTRQTFQVATIKVTDGPDLRAIHKLDPRDAQVVYLVDDRMRTILFDTFSPGTRVIVQGDYFDDVAYTPDGTSDLKFADFDPANDDGMKWDRLVIRLNRPIQIITSTTQPAQTRTSSTQNSTQPTTDVGR